MKSVNNFTLVFKTTVAEDFKTFQRPGSLLQSKVSYKLNLLFF